MNLHIPEKQTKFQLERMVLFSDAVFAIAITLLVIELRVPAPKEPITETGLVNALLILLPKFIGFLVSFFLVGIYWAVHHRLFAYLINYTSKLVWLNLLFLLGIVLMPFSTSFYSEYIFEYLKTPVILYTCNICYLGLMNFLLWRYMSDPARGLTVAIPKSLRQYFMFRSLAVPVIFLVMLTAYLFSPGLAIWIPPMIPFIMWMLTKKYKSRLNDEQI